MDVRLHLKHLKINISARPNTALGTGHRLIVSGLDKLLGRITQVSENFHAMLSFVQPRQTIGIG